MPMVSSNMLYSLGIIGILLVGTVYMTNAAGYFNAQGSWKQQYDRMAVSRDEWKENFEQKETELTQAYLTSINWEKRFEEMRSNRDSWEGKYWVMVQSRDQWRSNYNTMRSSRDGWESDYWEMKSDYNSMVSEKDEWISNYDYMRDSRDEWESDYWEIKAAHETVAQDRDKWLAQYDYMKQSRDSWESQYWSMKGERDVLQSDFDSVSSELVLTTEDRDGWKAEAQQVKQEKDNWESSYWQMKGSRDSLQTTYDGLQSKYTTLQSTYTTLQSTHTALQSSYDELLSEYESLSSNQTDWADLYNDLLDSYSALESQYNELEHAYLLSEALPIGHLLDNYYDEVRELESSSGWDWWWDIFIGDSTQDQVDLCANLAKHSLARVYWSSLEDDYMRLFRITHPYDEHSYETASRELDEVYQLLGISPSDPPVVRVEKILGFMSSYITWEADFNEIFLSPVETLAFRSGDCDDFATLASAFFEKAGIDSAVAFFRRGTEGHAMTLIRLDDLGPYSSYGYSNLVGLGLQAGTWILIEPQAPVDSQASTWVHDWYSYLEVAAEV